jgi:hypothetical protein
MSLKQLLLVTGATCFISGTAFALPAPYTDAELEAAATLIVDAEVTEAKCVGEPVVESTPDGGTKTTSTYQSTLIVSMTHKGDAVTMVTIQGTAAEYSGNPPIGGWTQPALSVGTKGTFYLKPGGSSMGHTFVWWNALKEADSSVPGDLPACGDPGPGPGPDPVLVLPNECWGEKCPTELDACKAQPSCVAWNQCSLIDDDDEKTTCYQGVGEKNPDHIDAETGNHVLYYALQECGWKACNDPNAGSCADPGKNGAENRCDQWDDAWVCNCDDACPQYEDCCADLEEVCGGETPPPPEPDCLTDADCPAGQTCTDGACQPTACTPACDGKQCGDDGCGATCGTCEGASSCTAAGICESEPPACTDACEEGSKGCTEKTPWTCEKGASGCFEKVPGNACEGCVDGGCPAVDPEDEPKTGGGGGSSSGCSVTNVGHTGAILLPLFLLLGLAILRRKRLGLQN